MSVFVAIVSMFSWGASDYAGGVASRRTHPLTVGAISFAAELITGLVAFAIIGGTFRVSDMAYGLAAGVAGAFALPFFYYAISRGRVGIVAPIAGVVGAIVPALVGTIGGAQLTLLQIVGVLVALPAVWLISSSSGMQALANTSVRTDVINGLVCGLGFSIYLVLIGQIDHGAGALPTVWVGVATNSVVLCLLLARKLERKVDRRSIAPAATAGALNAAGTLLFVTATQLDSLSVAGVITALYPAVTIGLARVLDKEPVSGRQFLGILLALTTVGLIATG